LLLRCLPFRHCCTNSYQRAPENCSFCCQHANTVSTPLPTGMPALAVGAALPVPVVSLLSCSRAHIIICISCAPAFTCSAACRIHTRLLNATRLPFSSPPPPPPHAPATCHPGAFLPRMQHPPPTLPLPPYRTIAVLGRLCTASGCAGYFRYARATCAFRTRALLFRTATRGGARPFYLPRVPSPLLRALVVGCLPDRTAIYYRYRELTPYHLGCCWTL